MLDFSSQNRSYWYGLLFIFTSALIARFAFWYFTNWTIEDGMIIARMIKNLVEYGQFSFNVGERVSSSTSPVFGLMAAAIAITGISPLASAKLLGAFTSSLTAVLIYKILYELNTNNYFFNTKRKYFTVTAVSGSMIFVLMPPIIAYSVSGLETSFYMFLCAISLERLSYRTNQAARKAAIWFATFAALFRPDGFILLVIVSIIILWDGRLNFPRAALELWPALVLIPLYLLIHQLYFGSPVPQSFLAKANGYVINIPVNASRYLNQMLFAQPGSILFYILTFVGVFWTFKRARHLMVFIYWYLIYHIFFILRAPLFDWYLQVPLFVLCLFSTFGIFAIIELFTNLFNLPEWTSILKTMAGFGFGIVLLAAMVPYTRSRLAYQLYELNVRGAAGQWLTDNTPQDALVFTESLGYIGYYAHNSFVDWPGIASLKVPNLLIRNGTQKNRIKAFDTIISNYEPDYLVLRTNEWDNLDPYLRNQYIICKNFNPPPNYSGTGYLVAGLSCP
jgi:hypothetical protein